VGHIGQTGNLIFTLLNNNKGQDSQIWSNNASTDGLPLAFTSASWTVARVAFGQQQTHTGWMHNTLLHRETLLVVATSDLEDVILKLRTNRVTGDFLSHSFVHKDTETAVIVDFDQLLGAIGGIARKEF
jgi:hypothetical protein